MRDNNHNKIYYYLIKHDAVPREKMIELGGAGFAARVYELNKAHREEFRIRCKNGHYSIEHYRDMSPVHKEVYPDHYHNGVYIYNQKALERIMRKATVKQRHAVLDVLCVGGSTESE